MDELELDALIAPTASLAVGAWQHSGFGSSSNAASLAGYPSVTIADRGVRWPSGGHPLLRPGVQRRCAVGAGLCPGAEAAAARHPHVHPPRGIGASGHACPENRRTRATTSATRDHGAQMSPWSRKVRTLRIGEVATKRRWWIGETGRDKVTSCPPTALSFRAPRGSAAISSGIGTPLVRMCHTLGNLMTLTRTPRDHRCAASFVGMTSGAGGATGEALIAETGGALMPRRIRSPTDG